MSAMDSMETAHPRTICDMEGVSGSDNGFPVQLVLDCKDGQFFVRGINEGGFACVDINLEELLAWLGKMCPEGIRNDAVISSLSAKFNC